MNTQICGSCITRSSQVWSQASLRLVTSNSRYTGEELFHVTPYHAIRLPNDTRVFYARDDHHAHHFSLLLIHIPDQAFRMANGASKKKEKGITGHVIGYPHEQGLSPCATRNEGWEPLKILVFWSWLNGNLPVLLLSKCLSSHFVLWLLFSHHAQYSFDLQLVDLVYRYTFMPGCLAEQSIKRVRCIT